jgi:hypothetical protein
MRGREKARRRCVEPREGAAAPERRRRAKDDDYNRRHEERRGGRPRWEKKPDRSGDIHAAVNAYTSKNTFAMPPSTLEPATTTPSPQREHHRVHLPLSSLLDFFSVWHRRRWGAPSGVFAWMPAFEPQHCRTTIEWRSWALMPPGPLSPCEDHLRSPAFEPRLSSRERRAPPRRPVTCPWLPGGCAGRARRGRACYKHGCGQRTPRVLHARPPASRAARDAAATR